MAIAGGKLKQVVEHQVKLEDIVAGEEPAK
jgi:hypothetical protein